MKQGLLFKDAPEGRFELYCTSYIPNTGSKRCELLFDNIGDYRKHTIKVHEIDWCIRELPNRPLRRFDTNQEELDNMKDKKCWCGLPKKDFAREKKWYNSKFCSDIHYKDWWFRTDNAAFHRHKFIKQAAKLCEICGKKRFDKPEDRIIVTFLEMDHIIAIVNGGEQWDEKNLQILCKDCHKVKTKADMNLSRKH